MGKIIAISIFKGGTGKTATAVSLCSALALQGKRVLLIDLDQQASATRHLGIDPEKEQMNMFHIFQRNVSPSTAIKELSHGFDAISGHSLLAAIEESMEEGDEALLKGLIQGIASEYNYVILDTPPGKAMLSLNALTAADQVIIPLQAERPALDGVNDLLVYIRDIVWDKHNPNLKIGGILPTMARKTTSHSSGIITKAREIWGDKVFPVEIPATIAFPRAFDKGLPFPLLMPDHEATHAYLKLASIIDNNKNK